MTTKALTPQQMADMIWLCRRLASALQNETPAVSGLESLAREAPPGAKRLAAAMRQHAAIGDCMARGLADLGVPSWVWGTLLSGEQQANPEYALTQVASRLELEQSLGEAADRRLRSFSLAFGRLSVMLALGVPILTGLEAAAEGLPDPHARDAIFAAREAVRQGADLSDALADAGLPPMTLDMIRDGEADNRLAEALSVIADYLLDAAQHGSARRPKKEVCNG
jgi:type II secretory pathway component PulF